MLFGFYIPPGAMLFGGLTLFVLVALQLLVGLRWIKLGRHWVKYHRWIGYALLVIAALHGVAGILFVTGWRVG